MKTLAKVMGGVLFAGAVLAVPAGAQTSYTTQGFFTSSAAGCNSSPFNALITAPNVAACSFGGFTLTFNGTSQVLIGDGGITSLGNFTSAGVVPLTSAPASTVFTLAIRQSFPTTGTGYSTGTISGSVMTAPPGSSNSSSLIWVPNQFVNINSTTYRLIFDNVGPAADIGLGLPITGTRGIQAQITSTPEPASMALLATGLVGLFGVARRRRVNKTA